MRTLLLRADDILRGRSWTTRAISAVPWLATCVVVFGTLYGGAMGSFGGLDGDRIWQVVFSGVKVPLLLGATFLIALPSFYVLNALVGLRADFGEALRALAAAQSGLAIVLASLAPLTLLWYATSSDYSSALRVNAVAFAIASGAGQKLLRDYYRPLIRRNPRHRAMLWTWLGLYVFVGIQMSWVLRPYIGAPDEPVQFFRDAKWENAYVVVARLFFR